MPKIGREQKNYENYTKTSNKVYVLHGKTLFNDTFFFSFSLSSIQIAFNIPGSCCCYLKKNRKKKKILRRAAAEAAVKLVYICEQNENK